MRKMTRDSISFAIVWIGGVVVGAMGKNLWWVFVAAATILAWTIFCVLTEVKP
jgi:hypothetical protein